MARQRARPAGLALCLAIYRYSASSLDHGKPLGFTRDSALTYPTVPDTAV